MKATIAIPTYNRTKYLDEMLAGVMQQHFKDYEVLIGDSSDHDNVLEMVEPYFTEGRIRYLRLPPKITLVSKLSALLKEAHGEWMVFLCDDDLLDTDYLSVLMEHAQSQPFATLIRCRFRIIDEKGNLLRMDPVSKFVMRPAEFLSHLFLPERKFFKMNISGILFHRETLLEEGGFREFPWTFYSDLLAWAMVGARGLSIFEKRALASIRAHSSSQTSAYEEDLQKAIQTNLAANDVIQRLLKRLWQEVTTTEDFEFLKIAERNLKIYMRRHLSRVYDHGFIAALSTDRPGLKEYLMSLFETMKKMKVPVFPSAWFYYWLGQVSYLMRRPLLDAVKQYKTKKWCS